MKRTQYLSIIPTFALLAAVPTIAQDGVPPSDDLSTQSERVALPIFVKASIGPEAYINDQDGERLGSVRDHILDRRTGRVVSVAIATSGEVGAAAHLVPFDRFEWNAETKELMLPVTAEELESMPEYKVAMTDDLEEAGDVSNGGQMTEAGMPLSDPTKVTSSLVVGSRIDAAEEPFATVGDLILEPNQGTIAFVLASAATADTLADPYIIPWRSMTWRESENEGEQGHLAIELTTDELASAPKLAHGDTVNLMTRETRASIYGFYKLSPPLVQ